MVTHKQKAHLGIEIPKRRNPRPPPAAVSNADSEVVVEESMALETHYVQLKEGDDVPLVSGATLILIFRSTYLQLDYGTF